MTDTAHIAHLPRTLVRWIATAVLSGMVVLGVPVVAHAADGATPTTTAVAGDDANAREAPVITWAVSPASHAARDGRSWIEADVDPGQTLTEHLSLHNLSDIEVTFSLTAADGYFTPTGRFSMLAADTPSTQSGTWITVTDRVTLAAGEQTILPFTITVPANATPGDHAAGIAASIHTEGTSADGTSIGVESRVGFRVMTRVTGELQPKLELRDVTASYDTAWNPFEPGVIRVEWTAENVGNTRLAATEDVSAATLGIAVGETAERSADAELLPGDERSFSAEIPRAWPLGFATVTLTAHSETIPDSGTAAQAVTQTVVVWALPLPQLIVVLGLALIVASLMIGRRRQRSQVERLVEAARADGMRAAVLATTGAPVATGGAAEPSNVGDTGAGGQTTAPTRRQRRR